MLRRSTQPVLKLSSGSRWGNTLLEAAWLFVPSLFHQCEINVIVWNHLICLCARKDHENAYNSILFRYCTKPEEITIFGTFKKFQSNQTFIWRTFLLRFSKLRSMEMPFPPLSTSSSLPSSRLMTLGLAKQTIRSGKTLPTDPKGNCGLYLRVSSSTCFTFLFQVKWVTAFFCHLLIFCIPCVRSKSLMLVGQFQVQ